MEPRAQKYHRERIGEALREELSVILEGELADPRIGLTTVTELLLAPGGRVAHVFINVIGGEHEASETLAGLNAAKGFIRHQLTVRLGLRHAPELIFRVDHSVEHESRVGELLARIKKREK